MRIGELLLEQGALRRDDLDASLRTQARYGGRLASIAVELGYVDGDRATRALSKLRRAPAAMEKHFDAIDPRSIGRLPAKVAARLGAIPLGPTPDGSGALLVAMIDPTDERALEELRFAASTKIVAGVALASRIGQALERWYGIARGRSFVAVAAAAGELEQEPTQHVLTEPIVRDTSDAFGVFDATSALAHWAAGPARPPSGAYPAGAKAAPRTLTPPRGVTPPPFPTLRPTTASGRPNVVRSVAPVPREDPVDANDARRLEGSFSSETRRVALEAALASLLASMRESFEAALIFAVRNDVATAWKGFAPTFAGHGGSTEARVAVPLTQPSFLVLAYEARAPFVGPPPPAGSEVHARIWRALRSAPTGEVVVLPVEVSGAIVALVYAHPRRGEAVARDDIEALMARVARVGW
jgi:hypothetical protein